MTDNADLDRLFAEARAAMRAEMKVKKARVPSAAEVTAEERLRAELAPLENWQRVRGIALVHRETHTLIGTFTEYRHPKAPGARRLVREYHEQPPEAVEEVTGCWEHKPEQPPVRSPRWHQSLSTQMDCVLGKLHMSAPNVCLRAVFGEGRLDRVELVERTMFNSPRVPELLELPAGVNILPEMSQSSIDNLMKIIV
jgi:hypothetical protein